VFFDTRRLPPGFALSSPAGYARDLASQVGLFKTMGWAIDTWSIQSGTIDEATFLQDVDATVASIFQPKIQAVAEAYGRRSGSSSRHIAPVSRLRARSRGRCRSTRTIAMGGMRRLPSVC
jgi:hypothetical protein